MVKENRDLACPNYWSEWSLWSQLCQLHHRNYCLISLIIPDFLFGTSVVLASLWLGFWYSIYWYRNWLQILLKRCSDGVKVYSNPQSKNKNKKTFQYKEILSIKFSIAINSITRCVFQHKYQNNNKHDEVATQFQHPNSDRLIIQCEALFQQGLPQ